MQNDFDDNDFSIDLDDNETTDESTAQSSSAKELAEIKAMFEGKISSQEEEIKHLKTHTQKITSALKSLGDPEAVELSEGEAQYQRDIDTVKAKLITPEIERINARNFEDALESAGLDPEEVHAEFALARVKALKSGDKEKIKELTTIDDLYKAGKYASLAKHWLKFKGSELPAKSISFGVPITGQSGAGEKRHHDLESLTNEIEEAQGDFEKLAKVQEKIKKITKELDKQT